MSQDRNKLHAVYEKLVCQISFCCFLKNPQRSGRAVEVDETQSKAIQIAIAQRVGL